MKIRKQVYDYPHTVDEGLENGKQWYEFQLVQDDLIEMTEDEFSQLVCDEADCGHFLDGNILDTGNAIYIIQE